ncbi:class I SAM-dependent methyltransferase [Rossellomorea vietnamensis]|uniref:Class I SAM-dependent methyltransferase n=1 Tax=Rossellomorea vietnamensis TaxID=218284 RepID=A0A5D4M1C4_9BACI|nr:MULTISPECIES: class I SAM-dependent methyltransferase [Bacillaceae]TYR95332.1 class I SAM-dependent methyltransferase [Rossellomorea vietnamensis]
MIREYIRVWRARGWMKQNMPFLRSWHAYVGYELDLFKSFNKPASIKKVAAERELEYDLLKQWVEVGIILKHFKRMSAEKVKTIKKWKLPKSKSNRFSSGIILKEMMELHIPSLLAYPELLRNQSKQHFDSTVHGPTVAKTSSLLEQLAYPKIEKVMKKYKVDSIIDVGCGEAGYLRKLSKKFPDKKMVGVEVNEEVADNARNAVKEHGNIEILNKDINEYQPESKYKLVMANNLLHYIEPGDRTGFFQNAAQWIKKNGVLSIITPIQKPKHGKEFSSAFNSFFMTFDNLYPVPTEKDLKSFAKESGLKMVSIDPIIKEGGWYIAVFKK